MHRFVFGMVTLRSEHCNEEESSLLVVITRTTELLHRLQELLRCHEVGSTW